MYVSKFETFLCTVICPSIQQVRVARPVAQRRTSALRTAPSVVSGIILIQRKFLHIFVTLTDCYALWIVSRSNLFGQAPTQTHFAFFTYWPGVLRLLMAFL